jgi:hypothetical protein
VAVGVVVEPEPVKMVGLVVEVHLMELLPALEAQQVETATRLRQHHHKEIMEVLVSFLLPVAVVDHLLLGKTEQLVHITLAQAQKVATEATVQPQLFPAHR